VTDQTMETSPQVYARIGGVLYLMVIALGLFAEGFVGNKLIVSGDATATAHNIMASQSLWRIGVAANMIVPLCAVPLLLIEYVLLRPVGKNLVLLAVFFNLVSLAVEAVSKLFLLAVLPPLGNADYLTAFEPRQLQALAYLALKSHDVGFNIALIFFGFTCIINGYLIFKSRYLPKFVGILMQIAGACYLTACFAALFAPTFYDLISPAILIPSFIGESSYCLWLLVKGVDVPKWIERTSLDTVGGASTPWPHSTTP
jgi:hypothetical protein